MSKVDSLHMDQFKVMTNISVIGFNLLEFPIELDLARQALIDLRSEHPESTPSNVVATYMSPWKSHLLTDKLGPLIHVMSELIMKISVDFYTRDLAQLNFRLAVADCWGAIYEAGDYSGLHHHFPADFASVVYLDVDAQASPIIFSNSLEVHPQSATAIVFPGLLEHHVPPTNGRRVVIAINFIKIPAVD